MVNERFLHFPYSGVQAIRAQGVDQETGQPRRVYLDEKGVTTTLDTLDEEEALARFEAIGRMEPALADLVDSLSDAESLPVYIVAPVDLRALEFDRRRIAEGDEAYRQAVVLEQNEVVFDAQDRLTELLAQNLYTPDYYVPGVPAVHVVLLKLVSKDAVPKNVGWQPDGSRPTTPYELPRPDGNNYNQNPRIGVLPNNHYTVVWQSDFNSNLSEVWFREFEKHDPVPLSATERLDLGSSTKSITPDAADAVVDAGQGTTWQWFVWLRSSTGYVWASKRAEFYSQWSIANATPASAIYAPSVMPSVAAFPDGSIKEGGAVVAFIRSPGAGTGQISGRCVNSSGSVDSVLTPDNGSAQGVRNPAVGMFDDGSFVIAWHDVSADRIKYRLYSSSCVAVGSTAYVLCTGLRDLACTQSSSHPDNDMLGRLGLATGRLMVSDVSKKAFRIGYMTDPSGSPSLHQLVTRLVHVGDNLLSPILARQDVVQQESSVSWFDKQSNVSIAMDPECGNDVMAVWAGCSPQTGLDLTDECNVSGQQVPQFDMRISARPVRWPLP